MVVVCSNLVAGYLVGIVRLEKILTMEPKIRHSDVLTEFETHEFIGLSLGSKKKREHRTCCRQEGHECLVSKFESISNFWEPRGSVGYGSTP